MLSVLARQDLGAGAGGTLMTGRPGDRTGAGGNLPAHSAELGQPDGYGRAPVLSAPVSAAAAFS